MRSKGCAVGRTQQQTIPLRGRQAVTGYASGKISACCLVVANRHFLPSAPLYPAILRVTPPKFHQRL